MPGKKTLKRPQRLQKARDWLPTYQGKKLVKGYAKKFGTDLITAVTELRMLGVQISQEYETALRSTLAAIAAKKCNNKAAKLIDDDFYLDQDDTFAYIVGYTSGGAPYGLRWEEVE